ncbi:porin [Tundrisphaera sp. TA3]|uniref:porin n=1 Tax=Tundrisphaera sp. TA3 TaxID=3435775 RepID=UPI003EC09132
MLCLAAMGRDSSGQEPPAVAPLDPPASATNAELMEEFRKLRAEVDETRKLQQEVLRLRDEVAGLRAGGGGPPARHEAAPTGPGTGVGPGYADGVPERYHSGAFASDQPEKADADDYPLSRARYRYHHDATGPNGGGGYFGITSFNDEFTLNLSNQITVDGTFFDRANLPTIEQGFNIPFARTYLYGNITKDFSYQVGVQGSLGTFNLLDLFMAWHLTENITLRAGKGLAPPLYEYYAFSPALEPVITNSPLYQLAAKRPIGLMLTGTNFGDRVQWWSGMSNEGTSAFGNLNRNIEYNGAIDVTPFRGDDWAGTIWEGLGAGVGVSVGNNRYKLDQSGIAYTNNGEATTNPSFTTVVGLPFFVYKDGVAADGIRTRVAPHIYWFGRFSVLAEYMDFSRELTDGTNRANSTQRGYYVNASYWLTGERDFKGSGFQGYSTIEPLLPFIPSRGQYGPGAWQIAAQWSEFNAGTSDIANGFADSARSTNRMGNLMVGLNWWPNKYTRLSADYVSTGFNRAIPLVGPGSIQEYQTFWMRFAMFF